MKNAATTETVLAEILKQGAKTILHTPIFLQHYTNLQLLTEGTMVECLAVIKKDTAAETTTLLSDICSEIRERATKN